MKNIIFIGVLLLLVGCSLSQNCAESEDVCALFDCMVDRCWCDDSTPEMPILHESKQSILNEEQAKELVKEFLDKDYEVKRAVRLNNVFFNVFTDKDSDEVVFTVSKDGTILKTICGV